MDLSEAPGRTNLVSANRINLLPSEILMHNKISKIENKKPGYSQQLETTHAEEFAANTYSHSSASVSSERGDNPIGLVRINTHPTAYGNPRIHYFLTQSNNSQEGK